MVNNPVAYQLTRLPGVVQRLHDGAFLTDDPESGDPKNGDWLAYEAWLAAGNTPQPAPTKPSPRSVAAPTPEQRLARAGLTPQELHGLLAPLIHEQIDRAVRKGGGPSKT